MLVAEAATALLAEVATALEDGGHSWSSSCTSFLNEMLDPSGLQGTRDSGRQGWSSWGQAAWAAASGACGGGEERWRAVACSEP